MYSDLTIDNTENNPSDNDFFQSVEELKLSFNEDLKRYDIKNINLNEYLDPNIDFLAILIKKLPKNLCLHFLNIAFTLDFDETPYKESYLFLVKNFPVLTKYTDEIIYTASLIDLDLFKDILLKNQEVLETEEAVFPTKSKEIFLNELQILFACFSLYEKNEEHQKHFSHIYKTLVKKVSGFDLDLGKINNIFSFNNAISKNNELQTFVKKFFHNFFVIYIFNLNNQKVCENEAEKQERNSKTLNILNGINKYTNNLPDEHKYLGECLKDLINFHYF